MLRKLQDCKAGGSQHHDCCRVKRWINSKRSKNNTQQQYTTVRELRGFIPRRLLDISRTTGRLIDNTYRYFSDGKDKNYPPKYAALSYCWGNRADSDLQLKTTSATCRQQRMRHISYRDLSPVQQDAVTVASAMGLRYLWIDALCIIQGDYDDWIEQSREMSAIYCSAQFTIVSLMGSNQMSFLNPQRIETEVSFESTIEPGARGKYQLLMDGVETVASGPKAINKLSKNLPSNRWVTRGWTFQEQYMSRRLFLFGPLGVRFVCPSLSESSAERGDNSEGGRDLDEYQQQPDTDDEVLSNEDTESDSESDSENRSATERPKTILLALAKRKNGSQYIYERWCQFAIEFSGRIFTSREDMFPALSGIAESFSRELEDEYLAGVWSGDLKPWGLMWRYNRTPPPHKSLDSLLSHLEAESALLPSWTWVGRYDIMFTRWDDELMVTHKSDMSQMECSLRDSYAKPSTYSNPFGGFDEARIVTESAKIFPRPGDDDEGTSFQYNILEKGRYAHEISLGINGLRMDCMMDWDTSELNETLEIDQRLFFLLLNSIGAEDSDENDRTAVGLVLCLHSNHTKLEFRRVGTFMSEPGRGGTALFNIPRVQHRIEIF
jgi:hypothetical protein